MKIADLLLIYTAIAITLILIDRWRDYRKRKKLLEEKQRKSKKYNYIIEEMGR